jgi:signal transduction histidine kinase
MFARQESLEKHEEKPQKPEVQRLERLKEPRKKVALHAFASDIDDVVDVKCMIREMSKGRCRIASNHVDDLPRIIHLLPEGFERPLLGKIIWRTSKVAGVQFIDENEARELGEKIRPKPEALQSVGFFSRLGTTMSLRRHSGHASKDDRHASGLLGYTTRVLHGSCRPLESIKSLLNLVLGDTVRPIPHKAKSVIRAAHGSAENAEKLLGDAVHADGVSSGRLPCRHSPLDMVEFVRDAVLVNTGFAAKYNVRFEVQENVGTAMVEADAARLGEVIANLLSSAARFSPVGETVLVSLSRNQDAIRLSVVDRGAGSNVLLGDADGKHSMLPDDNDLEIGLDVCRAILAQHSSVLHVESHPGHGTTAWFELAETAS